MSSAAERAAAAGLPKLGGRPPLGQYLSKLWDRRFFTFELARSRFRAENEQERLGILWTVLRPLINVVVYGSVFGLLLPSSTRPANFVPYLVVGVFTFQYFQSCLQAGARSIIGNLGLMRSLHFPRAVLPIAVVIEQTLSLLPMIVLMGIMVAVWGEDFSLMWFLLIPVYMLMAMFCLGVAFVAARLTIHVRDIAQLIPYLARLLFYVSGVFFSIERLPAVRHHEVVHAILVGNPLNVYIELVRESILTGDHATNLTWVLGVIWAFAMLAIGFLFFWRAEERYGRES